MPTIDTQKFLELCEKAGEVASWDMETSGLGADYQSSLLLTVKPYKREPIVFTADRYNKDKKLVREAKECLEKFTILIAHNGKMFDLTFLNTRLLYWGLQPLAKRYHVDTYQQLKYKLRTASKSLAAVAAFLKLDQQKMAVNPDVWQDFWISEDAREILTRRNISDCEVLEMVYDRTKHLFRTLELC